MSIGNMKTLPRDADEISIGEEYALEAKYDGRRSFYGKAGVRFIRTREGPGSPRRIVAVLRSYSSIIAECDADGTVQETEDMRGSPTTRRHFREFQKQAEELGWRIRNLLERET